MTDRTTMDDRLLDWLAEGPSHAPTDLLPELLAGLPAQRRRRGWGIGHRPAGRAVRYGVAVAAGAVLTAGLLAVAGELRPTPAPAVIVDPSHAPEASPPGPRQMGSTLLTEPMLTARADSSAVTLADGRILFVRGVDPEGLAIWAEPFDPVAYRFGIPQMLAHGGADSTAVLLEDGTVFVTGGAAGAASERVRVPPPATPDDRGTVTPVAQDRWRTQAAVTRLRDGRVLLAGGTDLSDTLETAQIYDPETDSFTLTDELVVPRRRAFAVTLPDGRVLLAGGVDGADVPVALVEVWDPLSGVWSPLGDLPVPIAVTSVTALPDGAVLVVGTRQEPGYAGWWSTPVRIELADGTLTALPGNDVSADATISLLPDGDVLAIGGRFLLPEGPVADEAIVRLDPLTGETRETAQLRTARWRHSAVVLPDGSVLVAGGDSDATSEPGRTSPTLLDSAELLLRP